MSTRIYLVAGLSILLPCSALAYDLNFNGNDYGKFNASLKAMHILSDKGNGFDPSNGTAYLAKLKYQTPDFDGFKVTLGQYITADLLGLTDFTPTPDKERVARGMFMNRDGSTDYQLGEIFGRYEGDLFDFQIGRGLLDTPLTTIAYSMTPNFYSAGTAAARPLKGLELQAGLITEMSFGARAATDWGLIGERTPTAGVALDPREENTTVGLRQGRFFDISTVAVGKSAPSTTGITLLNASYTGIENLTLSGWNYYADDIANSMYFEGDYVIPVKSMKAKVKLSGQYLRQDGVGDEITKGRYGVNESLDYSLFGAKVAFGTKKWSVYAAANNSSGDTWFYNAFGGDPAYTSTIFSRNAYRENVNAWKVGGSFSPMKGVKLMAHYADYGKSDSQGYFGGGGPVSPVTDAKELNLVAVYKPRKDTLLKVFYAKRTSEYDGVVVPGSIGPGGKQSHLRFVGQYDF